MKIKKIVYKQLYKILRKKFIKEKITQLGKIVEEDDRIICYVEQKKFDEYIKKSHTLRLYGFNCLIESNKKIIEGFKLNKPVYYIFDNITFSLFTTISSAFSSIIFKNCTFSNDINVRFADELTFEHNIYNGWHSIDTKASFKVNANKLKLINENFKNIEETIYVQYDTFGMEIETNTLEITNSEIDTGKKCFVHIDSKQVAINNSIIKTPEFIINSKNVDFKNSVIKASKGVLIEGESNTINELIVNTPTLVFNNEEINGKDKVVNAVDESINLENSRLNLLYTLKQISLNCKNEITKDLEQKQTELLNNKVKTILK